MSTEAMLEKIDTTLRRLLETARDVCTEVDSVREQLAGLRRDVEDRVDGAARLAERAVVALERLALAQTVAAFGAGLPADELCYHPNADDIPETPGGHAGRAWFVARAELASKIVPRVVKRRSTRSGAINETADGRRVVAKATACGLEFETVDAPADVDRTTRKDP